MVGRKPSILQRAVNAVWYATHPADNGGVMSVDDLDAWGYAGQTSFSDWEQSIYDGGKFAGGFGPTQIQHIDYWTMRARSAQLFNENLYARGLIRRLVTNEIGPGLSPEATPDENILGIDADTLADWSEERESRFLLWGKSPQVCDWLRQDTFGAIQRRARREALIEGDILVVMRQDRRTNLPAVQLIRGGAVQTPYGQNTKLRKGHTITHGVEFDAVGRVAAHWVRRADGSFDRVPAWGERSGRRLSWLVYGTDRRMDDVRGQPLLALVMQSLKEVDRYRDSVQRKVVVNSFMAMFVKKGSAKPGSLPMTGGAVKRGAAQVSDSSTGNVPRQLNVSKYVPGLIVDELQEGEEPVLRGGEGTDVNFGAFEEAIVQAVAWANEIPPEILRLAFSNNYSASQAAINEFKIYLNRIWSEFGEEFCTPIYAEWSISEALNSQNSAPGLLAAWRDPRSHDVLAAWLSTDWYGSIKPSTDTLKQAKGSKLLVDECWSTNAREARVTTGTKFTTNAKRVERENALKAAAARPLLELRSEFGGQATEDALASVGDQVVEALDDWRQD